jgi:hypothetical protein
MGSVERLKSKGTPPKYETDTACGFEVAFWGASVKILKTQTCHNSPGTPGPNEQF